MFANSWVNDFITGSLQRWSGPIGAEDGFMALICNFGNKAAKIAGVVKAAIGVLATWFWTFIEAVAQRLHG